MYQSIPLMVSTYFLARINFMLQTQAAIIVDTNFAKKILKLHHCQANFRLMSIT